MKYRVTATLANGGTTAVLVHDLEATNEGRAAFQAGHLSGKSHPRAMGWTTVGVTVEPVQEPAEVTAAW